MLIRILLMVAFLVCMNGVARAEFVAPTSAQLDAVALDPKSVESLLSEATDTQAAEVMRDAVARIMSLGLSDAQQSARISSLIKSAFAAWTGQPSALATALGQALAADASMVAVPAVISTVQQSIMALDGTSDGDVGGAFSLAYQASLPAPVVTGSGKPGDQNIVAPPVALTYEGQNLI